MLIRATCALSVTLLVACTAGGAPGAADVPCACAYGAMGRALPAETTIVARRPLLVAATVGTDSEPPSVSGLQWQVRAADGGAVPAGLVADSFWITCRGRRLAARAAGTRPQPAAALVEGGTYVPSYFWVVSTFGIELRVRTPDGASALLHGPAVQAPTGGAWTLTSPRACRLT